MLNFKLDSRMNKSLVWVDLRISKKFYMDSLKKDWNGTHPFCDHDLSLIEQFLVNGKFDRAKNKTNNNDQQFHLSY